MSLQPISLGELIALLTPCKQDVSIHFDFGDFRPTDVDSFRGYYDHLAIGFSDEGDPKVSDLLAQLNAAVGKSFTGYKGGDYTMTRRTPMWVANYGRSTSTAVVGVEQTDWCVVINTGYCEDWEGGMERAASMILTQMRAGRAS